MNRKRIAFGMIATWALIVAVAACQDENELEQFDLDGNGVPCQTGDGLVVSELFPEKDMRLDFNQDGVVNQDDLSVFFAACNG